MKKIAKAIFAVPLFAFLLTFKSACADTKTYVLDAQNKRDIQTVTRVTLKNNWVLDAKKLATDEHAIVATSLDGKSNRKLVKNDNVQVLAAYPNKDRAAAVLVSDSCGGSMCRWEDLTLILPTKSGVKAFPIGDAKKVTLSITNGIVTQAKAEGVSNGVDKYGSTRQKTLYFNPHAGFLIKNFKHQYTKLFGNHPEKFFADPELRETLARAGNDLASSCSPHICPHNQNRGHKFA